MKKRTIIAGTILAASMANAAGDVDVAGYLKEQTGPAQKEVKELCLQVEPMFLSSMMPRHVSSTIIGLKVADNAESYDLVIDTDRVTKQCPEGYVKISTTAPLRSVRSAPISL